MHKRILLLAVALSTLFLGGQAVADEPANVERIKQFDVDITLSKENIAQVQEHIVYDFGANYKHGMYRDIPVDYVDGSDRYYLQFTYEGTNDEQGQTVQVQQSNQSGNVRLRLGDPNQTITGAHTYNITYRLGPILYQKNGQLFLNYDVIGTGFTVPIDNARITFRTADGTALSELGCFQGSYGSKGSCVVDQTAPGVATTSLTGLQAGEGASLNAYLPASYTSNLLEAGKNAPRSPSITTVLSLLGGFSLFLFTPFFVFAYIAFKHIRLRLRDRRLRKNETIVPQYEAPDKLSPAEVGYLNDDVTNGVEITAVIIDLARRGHLKITQNEPPKGISKFWDNKPDYTFEKTNSAPTDQLSPAEIHIYSALFSKGSTVQLSGIDRKAMANAVKAFDSTIENIMKQKGFYGREGKFVQSNFLTKKGAHEWALVQGLKMYITVAEKDRLAFSDAPSKTPERFNMLLPYAIALGVEKEWVKQFEGIDLGLATQWYAGDFAALNFGSMSQGFDIALPSSSSSGSSFSSGGDFSGGGSGGGGGGSW